jgi:hypothetical protein
MGLGDNDDPEPRPLWSDLLQLVCLLGILVLAMHLVSAP